MSTRTDDLHKVMDQIEEAKGRILFLITTRAWDDRQSILLHETFGDLSDGLSRLHHVNASLKFPADPIAAISDRAASNNPTQEPPE